MEEVSLKALLEAGCHFGHKAERWHPKAKNFIYQERDGIHIIDLAKTKAGLVAAAEFIRETAKNGGEVLFVGTKRQAAAIIKEEAGNAGAPYISQRWIGGFLTNWEQVHRNLEKIRRLTEEEKTNAWKIYPKHERVKLSRYLRRLEQFYGGVVAIRELPKGVMVVDIRREAVVVREAARMEIPVVGIVDTNSDPTLVKYAIAANDDAVGSVRFLVHYLVEAYREGKDAREKEAASSRQQAEDSKQQAADSKQQIAGSEQVAVIENTSQKREDVGEIKTAKETTKSVESLEKPKKKRGRPKKEAKKEA